MNKWVFLGSFLALALSLLPLKAQELIEQTSPHTAALFLGAQDLHLPDPQRLPWILSVRRLSPSETLSPELFGYEILIDPLLTPQKGLLLQIISQSHTNFYARLDTYDSHHRLLAEPLEISNKAGTFQSETFSLPYPDIQKITLQTNQKQALRSVLLHLLEEKKQLQGKDTPSSSSPSHLFTRSFFPAFPHHDQEYWGRVRAILSREKIVLTPEQPLLFEIELEELPLLMSLTLTLEGVDPLHPLQLRLNKETPRDFHYLLPDLADPSYIGRLSSFEKGMHFLYLNPIPAQILILQDALRPLSPNTLQLSLPEGHPPIVLSHLVVELKYPSPYFDYLLEP